MREDPGHPVTLRFASRHLEAAFLREHVRGSLGHVRVALLLGIALYGPLFGAMDVVDAPGSYPVVWAVRLGVCLAALGVFLLTFARRFARYMQPALGLLMLLGGLGLVGVLTLEGTGPQFFNGPVLVVLAAYVVVRLRFVYATAVGWTTTVAYVVVAVGFRDEGAAFVASSVWFLVAANVIGMFAAYGLEKSARRDFCLVRSLDHRRRQLEEQAGALKTTNAELERALQHLRETQDRLVHARHMAGLGALTAGIAHVIMNPLNFVVNFAANSRGIVGDVGRADNPDERRDLLTDVEENLRRIEEHGRRAERIVRGMMAHARGGTGEWAPVDLNRLVDHFVDVAWHGRAGRQGAAPIEIVRDYGEGVGEVEVVPQEVGQALLNVLGNAFDAVAERAAGAHARGDAAYVPRVSVATRRAGGDVEVRVADNGPGIAEGVRQRVFEPFFTTKIGGAGAGLGLSMSHDIVVRGHGGALEVDGGGGGGTAVVMRLPALPERRSPGTTTGPSVPADALGRTGGPAAPAG